IAKEGFGDFVKAAVDIEQEIMAVGGELHADEEVLLTENEGSKRESVWGINIYPKKSEGERIEFDSMINLKPLFGNRSRGVEDEITRTKIQKIVEKLVI
ncbi:MAG: hypothetical protein UT37_C0003G0051, partial [Parcubacteria group bacterium GW2011_GWA2_39_18]